VDLPGIDFVSVARGFGCAARRLERAADFAPALFEALRAQTPNVLDVPIAATVPRLY
jgi:benzoylformate decarboxylase